jgi:hypothetical protein
MVLAVGGLLGVGGATLLSRHGNASGTLSDHTASSAAGQFTVTVTPQADGSAIRAVVVGLRQGEAYDMLAIGADGHNYVAAHNIATAGPQVIIGAVPIAPGQIRFCAVIQGTRDVVMVATAS